MPFINPGIGPLAQLGQTLNSASNLDARLRLQAAVQQRELQLQAQRDARTAALQQAQSQSHLSQVALDRAKTEAEQQKLAAALGFAQAYRAQREPQIYAPEFPEEEDQAFRELDTEVKAAKLAAMGQQHVPANLAQLMGMADPRTRMMLATGAKPIQMVPPSYTGVDVNTAKPTFTAPGRPLQPTQNRAAQTMANVLNMFQSPFGGFSVPKDEAQLAVYKEALAGLPAALQAMQAPQAPGAGTVLAPGAGGSSKDNDRAQGKALIQQNPTKAAAIRQRFLEAYGEPLD